MKLLVAVSGAAGGGHRSGRTTPFDTYFDGMHFRRDIGARALGVAC